VATLGVDTVWLQLLDEVPSTRDKSACNDNTDKQQYAAFSVIHLQLLLQYPAPTFMAINARGLNLFYHRQIDS